MESKTSERNNFGLTLTQFEQMKSELIGGHPKLFEHIFLAHFGQCMKFVRNKYDVDREVAYDCTMQALLIFRNRLVSNRIKYGNTRFLFTKIAVQEVLRHIKKSKIYVQYDGKQIDNVDEPSYEDTYFNLLKKAWSSLDDSCKKVLTLYYYNKMKIQEVSILMQKSEVAIRKQKQRCVEFLKKHVKK